MSCRYWLSFFIAICCCLLQGKSGIPTEAALRTEPPQYRILSNGTKVYYSYSAALANAIDQHKLGIFVFFNPSCDDVWEDIMKKDLCLSQNIFCACNFVILQPGLISPMEFYPKMDPMIHYIIEFQERFPNINISKPCVIFIKIDSEGQDHILHIFSQKYLLPQE